MKKIVLIFMIAVNIYGAEINECKEIFKEYSVSYDISHNLFKKGEYNESLIALNKSIKALEEFKIKKCIDIGENNNTEALYRELENILKENKELVLITEKLISIEK